MLNPSWNKQFAHLHDCVCLAESNWVSQRRWRGGGMVRGRESVGDMQADHLCMEVCVDMSLH